MVVGVGGERGSGDCSCQALRSPAIPVRINAITGAITPMKCQRNSNDSCM